MDIEGKRKFRPSYFPLWECQRISLTFFETHNFPVFSFDTEIHDPYTPPNFFPNEEMKTVNSHLLPGEPVRFLDDAGNVRMGILYDVQPYASTHRRPEVLMAHVHGVDGKPDLSGRVLVQRILQEGQ